MKNSAEIEIISRLVGAWRLVSWFEIKTTGERAYPLGEDAVGQIIYTKDGRMTAQLMAVQPERFRSDDWREASETESARAWKQYFGYFGRFTVDLDENAVIHHIDGSWFPNLVNSKQKRQFEFEDSRLVLKADTEWGRVQIIWERFDTGAKVGHI